MKRLTGIIIVLGLFLAACSAPEEAAPFEVDLSKYKDDFDTATINYGCKSPRNATLELSLDTNNWIINLSDTQLKCDVYITLEDFAEALDDAEVSNPELEVVQLYWLILSNSKDPLADGEVLYPAVKESKEVMLIKSQGSGHLKYSGVDPDDPDGPNIEWEWRFQAGWLAYESVVDTHQIRIVQHSPNAIKWVSPYSGSLAPASR